MDGMSTTLGSQSQEDWVMINNPSVDPYSVQAALDALLQMEAETSHLRRSYCDMCLKPCRTGLGGLCRACKELEYGERHDH